MWKDVIGWESYYEINENGDVRNKNTLHLVIGDKNGEGYPRVCLYNKNHNPQKQRFFRHRLVATVFIPNPESLPEVNHIDGNINNSSVDNLEWVTKIENEIHSRKFGKKEYKPFYVIWNDGAKEFFDTKGCLARKIGMTSSMVRFWLQKKSCSYINHGIKEINYCNS